MKKLIVLFTFGLLWSGSSIAQSQEQFDQLDFFYIVNSTVGGGGLERAQMELLSETIGRIKKSNTRSRIILFVSNGEEPLVAFENDDHRSFINRLYYSSHEYPLGKKQERNEWFRVFSELAPFKVNGMLNVHFFVPDSFEEAITGQFPMLLTFFDFMSLSAGINDINKQSFYFYNRMIADSRELTGIIEDRLSFGRSNDQAIFCKFIKP